MKRFFVGGLKALLPTILTLWVLTALIGFVGDYVAAPVTRLLHWSLITNRWGQSVLESTTPIRVYDKAYIKVAALEPGQTVQDYLVHAQAGEPFLLDLSKIDRARLYADMTERIPPVFGLAIGFVLIFVLGFFMRGYLGRILFHNGERLLFSFPLVRTIYPYAKQIVEFFLKDKSTLREFQTVVAVPYPSQGLYALGFVTSDGLRSLNDQTGGDYVSVFVPSSPTPMTGYLCFVRKEDIVPLALTLDQTMGLIISGGVIVPRDEMIDPTWRRMHPAVEATPGLAANLPPAPAAPLDR